jgi:predicted AAA+ superfamily ATPase
MFDHSVKKQQRNDKKTYVTDHAIIRNVSTQLTKDRGRILENIVANNLLSENHLFYFSGKQECDFVTIGKIKMCDFTRYAPI